MHLLNFQGIDTCTLILKRCMSSSHVLTTFPYFLLYMYNDMDMWWLYYHRMLSLLAYSSMWLSTALKKCILQRLLGTQK